MVGYTKDREFKDVLLKYHDKYVKENGLLYVKTNHAVAQLCVPADDRLITEMPREHHDGNTAAHPGICHTQLNLAQWYCWTNL